MTLNVTEQYVPPPTLLSIIGGPHTPRPIVKTGPALCMAGGSQNWVRGMMCVDGLRVTWLAKDGDVIEFTLNPSVLLLPVDRGGQIKGYLFLSPSPSPFPSPSVFIQTLSFDFNTLTMVFCRIISKADGILGISEHVQGVPASSQVLL